MWWLLDFITNLLYFAFLFLEGGFLLVTFLVAVAKNQTMKLKVWFILAYG